METKRDIVLEQIDLQEQMQVAGFNVVECGNCGSILIHKTDDEETIDCYCGTMDKSDCPDYYYRGMENNQEWN